VAGLAALILNRGALQTNSLKFLVPRSWLCCFRSVPHPPRADGDCAKTTKPFLLCRKGFSFVGVAGFEPTTSWYWLSISYSIL